MAHMSLDAVSQNDLIVPGDLVFDVGANIGDQAAAFIARGARVICFEPQPDCVARLRERFTGEPRVTVVSAGLAAQAGEMELSICSAANTISTFSADWQHGRFASYQWDRRLRVPVITLDEAIARHGHPRYVKIDVEGFELEVLRGLSSRVPLLSFEFTIELIEQMLECTRHLTKLGFLEFNAKLGTADTYMCDQWVSAGELFSRVQSWSDTNLWGDVYARAEVTESITELSFISQLRRASLWEEGRPLKLHLGCGEQHLDGYVNIDHPPSEHSVQAQGAADIFADITRLSFPPQSVDEIRLHHVFEHFDRVTALVLLCRWHHWLKLGGRLVIETPDMNASAALLHFDDYSYKQKQAVLRHVFGSNEASWAVHWDGWYEEKYRRVLTEIGFGALEFESGQWQMTRNIVVCASKCRDLSSLELRRSAEAVLRDSLIDESRSEQSMLQEWMKKYDRLAQHSMAHASEPPLVSIFMPAYNREKYLPATMDSLLAQSYINFEIIIADDGSTDGTLKLAHGYAARDARVKVLALHHQGEVIARNEAVAHAAPGAKYLMNHDSDDISLPDKLLKLVAFLESHPEIAIAGCFAEYFDDAGQPLGSPPIEHEPARIRATFGQANSMINSAALIRRGVFEKIGGYREEFRCADDYDFFTRALLAGFDLANLPEVLHRIRLHPSSVGSIHSSYMQELADVIRTNYREGRVPVSPPQPAIQSAPNSKTVKELLCILHTVEFYPPHTGGAEFVVQQISERLARRGHRVTVATSHLDDRNFRELNGVAVHGFAVQGKPAEGITGEAARYRQFLREHDADVMMNYAAQQWATDLAFDVVAETRGHRVNIIAPCGYSALTDHQTLRWPSFRDYFEHRLPEVLPLYDAAVYHSGIYQDFEYGRALNLHNGVIIPNGTDEEEFTRPVAVSFREKYNITTRFIGLCVANYYADKGQDQVIECVRQMNHPDFTMIFIGKEGGQCAALRQQATGLDIRFLINIPREDTVAAFRSADLFLFASRIEASPLVIIEAKAAGLPFVSTDCGNVREWQGGIVCAPEKMAAETLRLLNDDSLRKRLSHEGQQEWKKRLTWEAVTDQWEELYLRLHWQRQSAAKAGVARRQDVPVEQQRVLCQMHPLQKLPDPKKQCSRLMKENAKLLKKCRLLEQQVESATRWQSRSWFKRAFHKWRPAKAAPGKIEKREAGSQGDRMQA